MDNVNEDTEAKKLNVQCSSGSDVGQKQMETSSSSLIIIEMMEESSSSRRRNTGLTVRLQFAIACFGSCLTPPPNLLLPSGVRDPAWVLAKWHVNPANSLSRVRECDRRQTYRPRYGEMVATGEIACTGAILPNNNNYYSFLRIVVLILIN